MRHRLQAFFALPVLENIEMQFRARVLRAAMLATGALLALVFVAAFIIGLTDWVFSLWVTGLVVVFWVITGGLFGLLRRGQVRLASWLFTLALWAVITASLVYRNGIRGQAYALGYLTVIVLAGLVLSTRGALVMAGLCALTGLGLMYADWHQLILVTVMEQNALALWVIGSMFFAIVVSLQTLSIGVRREALARVQSELAERHRAEEALRVLNAELEQRVAARTADLLHAKETADVANRAKSDFLSSMSHELRTPLNGILGYAQIILRRPGVDDDTRKGVEIMQQSGTHLLDLIADILDFSKIEAQRLDLIPNPIHLASFLSGVAALVRLRAEEKRLTFAFEPAADLPLSVQADEKRLRQVLLNLLSNAVKFTQRGYVAFRVKAQPAARPAAATLRFEIEDSGPGLTPAQMAQLFKPFEQVGDAQQRAQGTGLGLAISQKLVQAMGGEIIITSTLGEGATFAFEVTLPLSATPVGGEARPGHREIKGYVGPRQKVLVADDKPYNRLVLINLLQPLGFEVIEAADGAQAIARTRLDQPAVIFMDLAMPVLTGFEAVQALRADAATAQTIIIGASASTFDEEKRQGMVAGCNGFITKPVEVAELYAMLEKLLQLEWVYTTEAMAALPTAAPPAAPLVLPPAAMLEELRALLDQGDLFGVEARVKQIAAANAAYAPFAAQVTALAQGFEDQKILALLG